MRVVVYYDMKDGTYHTHYESLIGISYYYERFTSIKRVYL